MWTEYLLSALLVAFLAYQGSLFLAVIDESRRLDYVTILLGTVLGLGLVVFSYNLGVRRGKENSGSGLGKPDALPTSPSGARKRIAEMRPLLRLRPRGDSGLGISPSPSFASITSEGVSLFGGKTVPSSPSREEMDSTAEKVGQSASVPPKSEAVPFLASSDPTESSFERFRARSVSNANISSIVSPIPSHLGAASAPGSATGSPAISAKTILTSSSSTKSLAVPVTPSQAAANHEGIERCIAESKTLLQQICGIQGGDKDLAGQIPWTLIRSGISTLLWMSRNKSDAILLKGYSSTTNSPAAVKSWLFDKGLTIGLEGITSISETIVLGGGKVFVRRVTCKSGSLTASPREFVIVTTVTFVPENGSYIITSRSAQEDFSLPPRRRSSTTSSLVGGLVTGSKRKELVRGFLHCSGFILMPRSSLSGDVFCDISFAVHCDMLGSARLNHSRIDPIAGALLAACTRLQEGCAEEFEQNQVPSHRPRNLSLCFDPRGAPVTSPRLTSAYQQGEGDNLEDQSAPPSITATTAASACASGEGGAVVGVSGELIAAAHAASVRLLDLHATFQAELAGGGEAGVWDFFFRGEEVTVGEMKSSTTSSGILAATCKAQAPPEVIQRLLLERPDAVDRLLEGRTILNRLDDNTFVQWLGYRSIWPIGPRDFLLATRSDRLASLDTPNQDGFIQCSTSIDTLCEEVDEGEDGELQAQRFSRSSLRTAGYIGTRNAQGGTDLTVIVDVDVYSYIPVWLTHVLAQYGLTEILTRIQRATMPGASIEEEDDDGDGGVQIDRLLSSMKEEEDAEAFVKNLAATSQQQRSRSCSPTTAAEPALTPAKESRPDERRPLTVETGEEDGEQEGGHASSSSAADAASMPPLRTPSPSGLLVRQTTPKTRPWVAESGAQLAGEAQRLMKIYTGLDPVAMKRIGLEWQEKGRRNNTTVYSSMLPGNCWQAVKSVTSFQASKEEILELLLNDNRICEFDEIFDTFSLVAKVDDKTSIRRMVFKAIWPTSPRDFLVCTTSIPNLPDGTAMIASRSASDALQAPVAGFVRGFIQVTGYYIEPYETLSDQAKLEVPQLQPGGCKSTFIVHTELGGTLPSSVINMLSVNAPLKMMSTIDHLLTTKPRPRK